MTLSVSQQGRGSLSELVARVDLFSLVEHYSGPGRTSGRVVTFTCPHPSHPDNNPSFTVTTTRAGKQVGKCWSSCGFGGDALELVKWLEGCSTGEAARRLRAFLGEPSTVLPPKLPTLVKREVLRVRELTDTPAQLTDQQAKPLLERYLRSRSWPSSVVGKFGLSVVLDSTGAPRIRHPYYSPNVVGEWCLSWWQDRALNESRTKWLSPKDAPSVLFNLRSLEDDTLQAVVICEGPADTITATLALEGVEGVAVIGVPGVGAWLPEWGKLLNGLRVVVAADNDAAGERLVASVNASTSEKVYAVKFPLKDLTDTAQERGLSSVRELLARAIQLQPKPTNKREGLVELLTRKFPGSYLVGGAA